ncbi:MAG: ABC transporter ATP-binding protein [Acidimicrobiia bacterium]|nr:ABC transporter ATP-binding protein [Acidimicrobiia bacterium]NNC74426.1 ABC transporter ATP-binding protein [Acidimicrobiia bacterium]
MILRGTSLELSKGELVVIIGPNGAGKSTLIKAIFGLLKPSRGSVTLEGEDIAGLMPHSIVARGVGYVPQVANVFPSLTVEENLDMGAYLQPRQAAARRRELFEWFPLLKERRKTRAGKLSGGQRQLVALARALMPDPKVLLLDEPSAGLSPANVDEIFQRIGEINGRGVSMVMVEQNARRALVNADRGYVLDQGTNAYSGPGRDLLHDPKVIELYLGGK